MGTFRIYLSQGTHNLGPYSCVWHTVWAFTWRKYKFAAIPALFRGSYEAYENILKKQWERKEVLTGGLSL